MHEDPQREIRREKAYERLGTRTPRCGRCTETDPAALTGTHPDILCYEHRREGQGAGPIEHDHIARKVNSAVTLPVPANLHRIKTDREHDWPKKTYMNADRSPIIAMAGGCRGVAEWLKLLVERILLPIATYLERLDAHLREALGALWWRATPGLEAL